MDLCEAGETDPWMLEALRLLQVASAADDMKIVVSAEIKVRVCFAVRCGTAAAQL